MDGGWWMVDDACMKMPCSNDDSATCSEGLKRRCRLLAVVRDGRRKRTTWVKRRGETGEKCEGWEAEMNDMSETTRGNGREEWRGGPALQTHPGSASRG